MTRAAACARAVVMAGVVLLCQGAAPSAQGAAPAVQKAAPDGPPTATTLLLFEGWMAAIAQHTPGELDDSIVKVRHWSVRDRQQWGLAADFFIRGYTHKGTMISGEVEKRLIEMGRDQEQAGGNEFLRRLALFHADVVILGGPPANDGPPPAAPGQGVLVIVNDGEYQGLVASDWSWPIARAWLRMLEPDPRRDPFVGDWYHATTAWMLGEGYFGEANEHLHQASLLLPDDARILTDRGCLAETIGLPRAQGVLTDEDIVASRIAQTPSARNPSLVRPTPMSRVIQPADQSNAAAEEFFKKAIDVDPNAAEAHLRLGRLLLLRGRNAEAARSLASAIASTKDPRLQYYARLFAARASIRLNDLATAGRHLAAAGELFPEAQSLLLARSRLGLVRADVTWAITPLDRIAEFGLEALSDRDPWGRYYVGTGRDAQALLATLWSRP